MRKKKRKKPFSLREHWGENERWVFIEEVFAKLRHWFSVL